MISVEEVKVFTQDASKGNLAGVVLDATMLSDSEMQQIAKAVNASETAFILPSDRADIRVRWFTPNKEVGICVHATIAAVGTWARATNDKRPLVSVETRNSILRTKREGSLIYVNIPDYIVENSSVDEELALRHFEIEKSELAGTPIIIGIYDDRELIIPVRTLATLKNLAPSIEGYSEICRLFGVTGLALFTEETFDGLHDVHLREFAPLYGYLEDPLCGMASGCILTYLRARGREVVGIKIEQGHFCNTSGTIDVQFENDSGTWIGGKHCFGEQIRI